MGGFAAFIPMAVAAASSIASSVQKDNAASDAADAQDQAVERRNQMIAAQQEQQEKQQRDLLDQQQATARAQMGAWGVGGDGGSSDAILQGMAQNAADSINAGNQLAQFRMDRNSLGGSSARGSSNLLDPNMLNNGLSVFQSFYGGGE
ncbi:hypothetical protein [Paramagnetospirillum kuznetsovii]|nr:hypothetical protein [Paramagnetospirillum kuznetsovii]